MIAAIDWSLILAGLAIIVSGITFWRQHVLQTRLGRIEVDRRREELEARTRADVVAKLVTRGSREQALIVWNRGQGEARQVVATFKLDHHPLLDRPFPLRLAPGQDADQGVAIPVAFAWGVLL